MPDSKFIKAYSDVVSKRKTATTDIDRVLLELRFQRLEDDIVKSPEVKEICWTLVLVGCLSRERSKSLQRRAGIRIRELMLDSGGDCEENIIDS
jgi:hypothetical protein